jgi:hypothetical protein
MISRLSTLFGALALLLAIIGLYGVTAYPSCGGLRRLVSAWRSVRSAAV